MTVTYRLGACTVTVDDENRCLWTRFPDATITTAAPNHDTDSIQRAHDLGYHGDTWAMTRDHELAHTWLAIEAGLDRSPVLWSLCHDPFALQLREVFDEEARVLDYQRQLDKNAARPWEVRG